MIWLRKGFVHLLALLLLSTLVGTAVATSLDLNFSSPTKLEAWLDQSKLYDHFVAQAVSQAQKSADNQNPGADNVSLSDTAVQQAAQDAFSAPLLKQSVNTFLNSNYAWLEGKTDKPSFTIDLTQPKQTFAEQVGAYVKTHLASLPVCTQQQLSQIDINNFDPLDVTCRPATIDPATEGRQVTQKMETGDFLSNPVLTPDSINPNESANSKPYYTKLSFAPTVYKYGVRLPWALAVLSLLLALGIVFIAPTRRKGLRRVGSTLLVAGLLLILGKFAADYVFTKIETKTFNNADVGQIQQSLTTFAHTAESELVKVDLYFGILFVILAIVCFVFVARSRGEKTGKQPTTPAQPAATNEISTPVTPAAAVSRPKVSLDGIGPAKPAAPKAKPVANNGAQPKLKPSGKHPRLVQ